LLFRIRSPLYLSYLLCRPNQWACAPRSSFPATPRAGSQPPASFRPQDQSVPSLAQASSAPSAPWFVVISSGCLFLAPLVSSAPLSVMCCLCYTLICVSPVLLVASLPPFPLFLTKDSDEPPPPHRPSTFPITTLPLLHRYVPSFACLWRPSSPRDFPVFELNPSVQWLHSCFLPAGYCDLRDAL